MKSGGMMRWAAIVAASVAAGLLWNMTVKYTDDAEKRNRNTVKAISNCRQIITALHAYAADHDGKYPDAFLTVPQNSNEVFRVLFKEGSTDNEMLFGCPVSTYVPDGNIGEGPDHAKALEAGENHWAMTTGLTDAMPGDIPLVYENAVPASIPPKWNPSAQGTHTPGRAWDTGIFIGLNDGSASMRKLESKSGTSVGLQKEKDGKDLFEAALDPIKYPGRRVLDVLRD
jgi:hypothetical protein